MIDLRSDTVTRPTPDMRQAMALADVGDDVYDEDPTVNRLEELACRMMGKEAALFVASGTMGNIAAILAHTGRGDEVICGYRSHIYRREQGAMATLAGVQARPIMEREDGTLPLEAIEAAVQPPDQHHPISRLVCLENTHNTCGGQPLTAEYTAAAVEVARRHGLKVHIDGARLFNAAVALGTAAEALVGRADSVTFCVSKGLAAPAGSLLCGDEAFIERARRARKLLGGGMRQVGVLAAAGIVALTSMVERLEEDHENARRMAGLLAEIEGIRVEPERVKTNIVYFDLDERSPWPAGELAALLKEQGVLLDVAGPRTLRAVAHYGITAAMVEEAVAAIRRRMGDGKA
jgi:threonine aldolase